MSKVERMTEVTKHQIKRLCEALQEAHNELKVAERRFADSGQDSAAMRMNLAARATREAIREHG